MNLSAPFIARPVATSLLAVALLLAGMLGLRMLPVAALPQVDFPTLQIITHLPGAGPETVASLLTAPLERQFGLIAGLTSMLSTSSEGQSAITLQFSLDKDLDVAVEDVQAAINAARGVLPPNLPYPPTYSKVNPTDPPVMTLALASDSLPMTKVNDVADTLLAQKLSQISGVGRVLTQGGQRPAWRIRIDPARLSGYGLTLEDVRTALSRANVNLPKGSFDGAQQAVTLNVNDQIGDIDTYRSVILAVNNGSPVRVGDVGTVEEGVENVRAGGWVNGHPAVIVDIQRQPGANVVDTARLVREALPLLTASIPAGVKLDILADRTQTIRASVADVEFTLVLTIGLVILVIWLFLRDWRATVIPGVALPLSLVATFGVMALCGFSLDNLSLMALTISAGFVVDDAIVMIENIVRYIEEGEKPMDAAYKGAREIGFTIVSLTVSLVAVFIPLLFMSGIVGRLFREFALTLTIAVLVSAVVSLTLTPMMCGRMLRRGQVKHEEDYFPSPIRGEAGRGAWLGEDSASHAPAPALPLQGRESYFERLRYQYAHSLNWVMTRQTLTLWFALATFIATIILYVMIPKGFLPQQDTGQIVVSTSAGETVSFKEMSRLQAELAQIALKDAEVESVASFLGVGAVNATPNAGRMTLVLKPLKERDSSAAEIAARLSRRMQVPGVEAFLQVAQDIQIGARQSRTQYQYTLADLDAAELSEWSGRLAEKLKTLPMLEDVATDQEEDGLKADIRIDRDAAARLGVLPQAIDDTLYDAFGQRQISTVYSQVNQYHVILEVEEPFRRGPQSLSSLYVRDTSGLVPLSAFAQVDYVRAPLLVTHQGQFPAVTISFNLKQGSSLGEAVKAISQAQRELEMPSAISGDYSGDAAEFRASLKNEPLLILAALVVIYIVLGVLYESLIHPLTILSTLPSAGVGALLALMLTGNDLSLVALIGILLLMGIVKKNAIMMIDFALVAEREHGLSPHEAIYKASLLRFRPIMMTTMAALLGAVPLAIDHGMGAELRRPLGIAIVGGLLVSQLLTLYTTPVIYLAMERLKRRLFPPPERGGDGVGVL